jgi:hypothetical protein
MQKFNFSQDLTNAFDSALSIYRNDKNVFGIDIGYKYENNRRKEEYCIRVHMSYNHGYNSNNPLINFITYTNYGMQARRRVLPINYQRRQKLSIIQPGISIGSAETGTLGLICFDTLSGYSPCLLTAAHVIAGQTGFFVSQPGPWIDGGHLFFDAIANSVRFDPYGDAAIATLNGRRNYSPEQFETSCIINKIRQVKLGDILTKSGRTTNLTTALVDGIGVYFQDSNYYRKSIEGFRLVPQDDQNSDNLEISDNGDSGAVWFDTNTNEGVGLLFAGENDNVNANQEFCLAQHLNDVFERLKISISKP